MKGRYLLPVPLVCGLALLAWQGMGRTDEPPPPPPQAQEGVDVQARGPVHEAYAEPTDQRPEPAPIVSKQPPDPVEEAPPDQKPEGDNVIWIPGYWSWDSDAQDFVWVSGFWRVPPPGRQWVPGHWAQVEDGYQWTPGFWAADDQDQVEYLPAPPPSIDSGPSVPAPDENSIYEPGCWVFRESRYLWRPGFWMAYRPDWLWVPSHYVCGSSGYVFIDGYWDRPLDDRGLLFAPCRFESDVLTDRRFVYTPRFVVRPDFLLGALFVRPSTCHYYFGDYFDRRYEERGFVPWVDYRVTRSSYDPLFTYYRHTYAEDRSWDRDLREFYRARFEGEVPRPPHTWIQQEKVVNNLTVNRTENVTVLKNINITHLHAVEALAPLDRVHEMRVTGLANLDRAAGSPERRTEARVIKLERVSEEQRHEQQRATEAYHKLAQDRRQQEARLVTGGATANRPAERPHTVKLDLPRAPATAPHRTEAGTRAAPPPPPQVPRHEERPIPRHEAPQPRREEVTPRRETTTPTPPRREERPVEPRRETPVTPTPAPREERTPEPRREPTPAPRREERTPEPRREERTPEPRREPTPAPATPNPRPPMPAPREERTPEPRREPAPAPAPAPRREERTPEPRREPAPEPRREPAPAPATPAPRPPMPAPREERTPEPRREPAPAPAPAPRREERTPEPRREPTPAPATPPARERPREQPPRQP